MRSRGWVQAITIILSILSLVVVSSRRTQAQAQGSQVEDLQQLKERLRQVEQEMQDLKGHITDVEAKAAATSPAPAPALAASQPSSTETVPSPKKNKIDLYGFIMLDSGYEFGQTDPNWFDVMR